MPQFIISSSDIRDGLVVIEGENFNHVKSLRICINDKVILLDENAHQYVARLEKLFAHKAIFKILNQISSHQKLSGIILAQSIIKSNKMHLAIQKATELGVDTIIPFKSQYSVVKIDEAHFMNRYKKIIIEAVSQSMRQYIPQLLYPTTFKNLIASTTDKKKILFHYGNNIKPIQEFDETIKQEKNVILIVGPEGGFSEDEIQFAQQHDTIIASLGLNILRAETATISAISIISFIRSLK